LLLLRWFGEGVGVNGIYIETQREEGKRGSWEFLLVPARKIINKIFGNEL
jgi:hypothetical protein